MKLTAFGQFVSLHSTMTTPGFWRKQLQDITRAGDEDSDWEHMIDERIRGLKELKARYYEFVNER